MAERALLLRVAVDTTSRKKKEKLWRSFKDVYPNGGFWGPFSRSGKSFEYVPVPEIETTCNGWKAVRYLQGRSGDKTYSNTYGERLRRPLIQTIEKTIGNRSSKFRNVAIHNDPDFQNLTYGDVPPKGTKCTDLDPGDLLIFCATLQNVKSKERDRGLFIIGYFTVGACYSLAKLEPEKLVRIVSRYRDKNAHFSRSFALSWGGTREELLKAYQQKDKDTKLILVVAKRKEKSRRVSGLLRNAIRITEKYANSHFYITEKYVRLLGLNKTRNAGGRLLFNIGSKWVNWDRSQKQYILELRKILATGGGFC